jgi:hypothetical protein
MTLDSPESTVGHDAATDGGMEVVDETVKANKRPFLELYGKYVLDLLAKAVLSGWTTEIRCPPPPPPPSLSLSPLLILILILVLMNNRLRILRGIDALLLAVERYCPIESASGLITGELMPQTLNALGQVIANEVSPVLSWL